MTGSSPSPALLTRVVPILAVVVLAGAAGFLAHRLTTRRASTISVAPVAAVPAQAPVEPPSTPVPREIPEAVPELTLTDTAGARHKLSEWQGRPALINFWATWCEPCRREIPLLLKLRSQRAHEGIEVIGVAVDSRDAVLKYARDMHIDYPVLIGEQDGLNAVQAFGMEPVLPFTVFTDSRARIVTLKVGELHAEEATLILSRVHDVDSGKLALPAARQEIAAGISELAAERARSSKIAPGSTLIGPN